MLNLQDIYDYLTQGELSQLSIGDDCTLANCEKSQLNSHIQRALTALYKKFRLKEGNVTVNLTAGTYLYEVNSAQLGVYLTSGETTFADDILKIEELFDQNNCPVSLNLRNGRYSVRTTTDTTLLVPAGLVEGDDYLAVDDVATSLKVVYKAAHPPIDSIEGRAYPAGVNIELPDTHLQALLFHVASTFTNPIGMIQEFHTGNNYHARYEQECVRLIEENMQIDDEGCFDRFYDKGFV